MPELPEVETIVQDLNKRLAGKQIKEVKIIDAKLINLPPAEFKEDASLDDGCISAGDIEFELIPSPGHTPDCVCFYNREDKILICGDVIFAQSTGRADLPGGNAGELRESVERLSRLEIEYLLPGHMDIVTGAENNKLNFNFIKENVIQWL